jgi:hypothetical protein
MAMENQQKTIRQGIIDDSQVTIFLAALQAAPNRIKEASDSLVDAEHELKLHEINELEQAKEALTQVELEIGFEVRQDTTLKNDKMREAAIAKQKKGNEEYVAAVNKLAQAKKHKAELEAKIGKNYNQKYYVRNLFQAYCACATMIGGLSHEQLQSEMVDAMKNLALTLSQIKEEASHV